MNSQNKESGRFIPRLFVFFTLYVAQGLPFGLQEKYIPLHYRSAGVNYSHLSLLRVIHLPWLLKVLMAPIVDKITRKYFCIAGSLFITACCYFFSSLLTLEDYYYMILTLLVSNLFLVLQDVAVDSMLINSFDKKDLGKGNLVQIVGFKVGMIIGGGTFGIIAQTWDLPAVFTLVSLSHLAAGIISLLYFTVERINPTTLSEKLQERDKSIKPVKGVAQPSRENQLGRRKSPLPNVLYYEDHARLKKLNSKVEGTDVSLPTAYFDIRDANYPYDWEHLEHRLNLVDLILAPGTLWTMIYVLVYKLGETGALNFFPLFLMDAGLNAHTVQWWNNIVGLALSIIGSVLGGIYSTSLEMIYRNLWVCSAFRSVGIFALLVVVLRTNELMNEKDNFWKCFVCFGVLLLLNFISGFLTTTTFTHMMHVSKRIPEVNRGFHYALLSVCELVGKLSMSLLMGPAVDWLGEDVSFTTYFVLSLLPFVLFISFPDNFLKYVLLLPEQTEGTKYLKKET